MILKLIHFLMLCVAINSFGATQQTPKGKEVQASLGTPMFTLKMLMPKEVAFIIVPPALTNITVSMYCTPTPGAWYSMFLGTNDTVNTDWSWSAVSGSNSASWTVRVLEGARFYGRVYAVKPSGTVKSEIASDQPFPPDSYVIWWTPPGKSTVIQVTSDLKSWTSRYSGVSSPITNKIDFSKSHEWFRAMTTNVLPDIGIDLIRTWNAKLEHYGGE